jgi:hypothetical protein
MDFASPPPSLRGGPAHVAAWTQQLIAWLAAQPVVSELPEIPESSSVCPAEWLEYSLSYDQFAGQPGTEYTLTLRSATGKPLIVLAAYLRVTADWIEEEFPDVHYSLAVGDQDNHASVLNGMSGQAAAAGLAHGLLLESDRDLTVTVYGWELVDLEQGTAQLGLLVVEADW